MTRIVVHPLSQRVSDDFHDNYAFTRHGVRVAVYVSTDVIWERDVWQRGMWWKWLVPSYERRVGRAKNKASRVAASLVSK